MGALAVEVRPEVQRPLAARLDVVAGGLEQHREVTGEQLRLPHHVERRRIVRRELERLVGGLLRGLRIGLRERDIRARERDVEVGLPGEPLDGGLGLGEVVAELEREDAACARERGAVVDGARGSAQLERQCITRLKGHGALLVRAEKYRAAADMHGRERARKVLALGDTARRLQRRDSLDAVFCRGTCV